MMTASIGGSTYEFGIKNYGATNNTMPAKLEIRHDPFDGPSVVSVDAADGKSGGHGRVLWHWTKFLGRRPDAPAA